MNHPKHVSPMDLYHLLLQAKWSTLFYFVTGCYLAVNATFGAAFWYVGGVSGTDGGPLDHFFFSVQTFATVGYGVMHPVSKLANWVVTAESICSLLINAMVTGIVFAKFSQTCKCDHCKVKHEDKA